jgi:predicted RND superfamily exporter protein
LEHDNRILGSAAMALMALAMLVAVRSPWWAILPLVSGTATWLITEAFLNAMNLRLTLSAGPIIAQTVVLCMPAASHLAMNYREAIRHYAPGEQAVRQTLTEVSVPILWCALTAAAGYLALLTSTVRPVFQFGLTMAACNVVAGTLTYALAAGAMAPPRFRRFSQWTDRARGEEASTRVQVVDRLIAWVANHPNRVLAALALPAFGIALGISQVRFESNYIRIYRAQSRVVQDYHFVEGRFGGIGIIELVLPGPKESKEISAAHLNELHEMGKSTAAAHNGLVTGVLSLADVLLPELAEHDGTAPQEPAGKKRTGILGGLLGRTRATPATPDEIIQAKLMVLNTPGFAHIVQNFWDGPTGRTRLVIRIRESADADYKQSAFERMLAAARSQFGPECTLTGLSYLMTQVTRAIISTQFRSTALSCVVILLMLGLALRSGRLALLALLPTLLAVTLVLGMMGWLGVRIDVSTALVASVAMGLSVDDTFHCLLRWRREIRSGRNADEALRVSYSGTGPGVVLSSLAVSVGFLALIGSEFVPTANFGWLVSVATLGGSIGNLVLLPACLAITSIRYSGVRSDRSAMHLDNGQSRRD